MKKNVSIVLLLLVVILPSGLFAAVKNEVVVCGWGGAFENAQREAYFDPFEKETGIKVITVQWPSAAKVKAMVQSGNVEWDIVVSGGGPYWTCLKNNLLEKIDYKYFDEKLLNELYPEAKEPYAVGAYFFSHVMTYRTDVYSNTNHPKNFVEFWDVKRFPGLRTLYNLEVGGSGWEWALLADGVPMDKLYINPNMDNAFRKMKEIKPHIAKWWKTGAEPGQLFVDKEVVLGVGYSGRIQLLKEQGGPVDYIWDEGKLTLDVYFIPKGAPNYKNALKLIAFASRADRQAHFAKLLAYGPVNKKAFDLLPMDRLRVLPSYPENKKVQFLQNKEWYMENEDKVIARWNRWILDK